MFRNISPRFLLSLAILAASVLLLSFAMWRTPAANAQGLVEYAIILSFVPEADCSVSSYEVEASDSLRVAKLNIAGTLSRDKKQCSFIVQGYASGLGSTESISGIQVFGDSLQIRKAELNRWQTGIDFVFWADADVIAGIKDRYELRVNLYPYP
jgi:hypothetical protein